MKKYLVEINDDLNYILEEGARKMDASVESFIAEILNRFALDPHIMEQEEVKDGYEQMGDINIKLSK